MPAVARAKGKANPQGDPRFKRVVDKLNQDSSKLKQHPPASKKAAEPAKAAKPPVNEKAAGARTKQVEKLEQAETKKPETSSFLALLQAEIAKAMPKTLGDTEKFMKGGSSEQMKGSLKGNVAEQKQQATGDIKKTSNETPSESGVATKPVTPIAPEPASVAPQVDAANAMPAPKPDAEVSLQASKDGVTDDLKKNKIDTLNKSAWQTDARYSTMLTSKDAVTKQADTTPAQYRAKEVGTLAQTAAKAVDTAKKGAATLLGAKGGNKAKVLSRQEQQKIKEEDELKKFTDSVVKIFADTKRTVDSRLEQLETKVNNMFDQGVEAALSAMKSFIEDQLFQYKLKRYLSIPLVGLARWIKDQILELPEEVNRFYEQGRSQFTTAMNALAVRVANLVETELAAAKNDVKIGQAKIASEASKLSPGVKTRAAQVQAEYAEKFNELESSIEDKKQQLAEGLAQKYKEAFDKMEEEQQKIKDENKGLWDKAKQAIGETVKALIEFKNRLMGILRKGAETIDLILKDPIAFLGNLIAAIKAGFNQFVGNIWTHLKAGFMKWLFGALTSAGIELPTDLSLPSILKLVLGVLGITYERMRAKAVKLIGERAVKAIEKVVEYITVLVNGGPAALWAKVKEDLSDLKAMVIDAIQNWIITTIVKKAVAKIVSMFNPAGAIIQAIMMTYDVVTFIIDKASQIMDFVEAVINSVHAIATGAIGGAANWIEKSLANMIPILIGFLANLIGLGGISAKIKEFITKVQSKVDKAIDKAIAKVVAVVKKMFGKGKDGKPDERTDAEKQKDLDQAITAANQLLTNGDETSDSVKSKLPPLQNKHRLQSLTLIEKSPATYVVRGVVNPNKETPPQTLEGDNFNVAPHTATKPAKATEDGESHHVPVKVLLSFFAQLLKVAATSLKNDDSKNSVQDQAAINDAAYASDGKGLSAIWISAKAHKQVHSISTSVSNSEVGPVKSKAQLRLEKSKKLEAEIIKEAEADALKGGAIVPKTGTGTVMVKSQIKPLLAFTRRDIKGIHVDKLKRGEKKLDDDYLGELESTLGKVFRGALAAGLAMLARAKLNPKSADWRGTLTSLANTTWIKHLKAK